MIDKYTNARQAREKYTDEILRSIASKKIVVAGPGTGKTHLFKKVLEGKRKALTLTFVNSLVDDLSLELYGLSEVKTLHGFARSRLASKAKIYPKLNKVIEQDAEIIKGQKTDFEKIFRNREDEKKELEFYSSRRKYYNPYFGYLDIIYNIVIIFENDHSKIPVYDQVLVDEFQDFNLLEVSLIDLLAEKSPILIAGDDDQALYDFKDASTKHIRDRHSGGEYEVFPLPYCSRCTRVIVEAANDIISSAQKAGNLKKRINKSYLYFDDPEKDQESAQYPTIIHSYNYAKQTPWFITKEINEIAKNVRSKFTVLVATPTKAQAKAMAKGLIDKGFENVEYGTKDSEKDPTVAEAIKILLTDKKSNLGWRIVAKNKMSKHDFKRLLLDVHKNKSKKIYDQLADELKEPIVEALDELKQFTKDESSISDERLEVILNKLEVNQRPMKLNAVKEKAGIEKGVTNRMPTKKIPIKVTTISSSKGLSAEYVFLTHFDDQFYIRGDSASDQDICSFLVALTRARKRVYLVSCNKDKLDPIFLSWINAARIEKK